MLHKKWDHDCVIYCHTLGCPSKWSTADTRSMHRYITYVYCTFHWYSGCIAHNWPNRNISYNLLYILFGRLILREYFCWCLQTLVLQNYGCNWQTSGIPTWMLVAIFSSLTSKKKVIQWGHIWKLHSFLSMGEQHFLWIGWELLNTGRLFPQPLCYSQCDNYKWSTVTFNLIY